MNHVDLYGFKIQVRTLAIVAARLAWRLGQKGWGARVICASSVFASVWGKRIAIFDFSHQKILLRNKVKNFVKNLISKLYGYGQYLCKLYGKRLSFVTTIEND